MSELGRSLLQMELGYEHVGIKAGQLYGQLLRLKMREINRTEPQPPNPNGPKPILNQKPIPYHHSRSDADLMRSVVAETAEDYVIELGGFRSDLCMSIL